MKRIFSLLAALTPLLCSAQLVADFTSNTTSGCAPLTVSFSDLSSGGGTIVYREWTFGFSGNTSNNNNPTPVSAYPNSGVYTVILKVSDGNDTAVVTKQDYITVHAKPNVAFTFNPSNGCAPMSVNFNNTSTAGSGTIASYLWDFGDGTPYSTQANPTHNYTSSGVFQPSLKVTNSFGCHKTNGNGSVNTSGGPTASFTSSTNTACAAPLTVSFTNTSSGTAPFSYDWNLGVGGGSTAPNPSATYTSPGQYDVKLIVTDAFGCKDSIIQNNYVTIHDVQADFAVQSPACKGTGVNITNNSQGAYAYTWDWGDGTTGSGQNPTHAYQAGGTYTITLTAHAGGCTDTYTASVDIQEITPGFTTSPTYHCELPDVTQYQSTSTINFGSIDHYEWHFGDVSGTNEDTTGAATSFTRNVAGLFDDTLIVVSNLGCTARVVEPGNVLIELMDPYFSIAGASGCVPGTPAFADQSVSTPSYPITSWSWDFGNGSTASGSTATSVYNDTGCYKVQLTIQNAFGCLDSIEREVCYGDTPTAGFVLPLDSFCASDTVQYFDNSFDPQYNNEWHWSFSDGLIYHMEDPEVFHVDTGWIDLMYVVGHHHCRDTLYAQDVAYVKGPYAPFSPVLDCDTPMVRWMNPIWEGVQRFYWNFGDGSPLDSVNANPAHQYPASGDYTVTLETFNDSNGCSYYWERQVLIRNLFAGFGISNGGLSVDSVACSPASFIFNADSCEDEVGSYTWIYPGNDTSNYTMINDTHYFSNPGTYPVQLVVHDVNGCMRTKEREVFLSDPSADFGFDFSGGCDPVNMQFTDLSSSDTAISQWLWNFDDGTGNFTEQHPQHVFTAEGSYQVLLTVTDSIGCSDVRIKTVLIEFPLVDFDMDSTLCQYDIVPITNQSAGNDIQYSWSFGNGQTSTNVNPSVLYVDTGHFEVYLAIQDSLGCLDTAYQTVHVQPLPEASFFADSTDSPCIPLTVVFKDQTSSPYLTSWQWNFGDGTGSVVLDTTVAYHTYTQPGVYDVKLTVKTSYGCADSKTLKDFIKVSGPYAEFGFAPDSVCIGDEIAFFITENQRVFEYQWVFGDGEDTTVSGAVDTVYHRYDQVGTLTPVVIYFDTSGSCAIPYFDSVYIHKVKAAYDFFPDSVGCGRLNTRMVDESKGGNYYKWSFGDGRGSYERNPHIYFPRPGSYNVEQYIRNEQVGCEDSVQKLFVVHPEPEVRTGPDTLICRFDSFRVEATSEDRLIDWKWSPEADARPADEPVTYLSPETTKFLVVSGVDSNGCVGKDSIRVTVQDTPRVQLASDTTIVIGEEVVVEPYTDDELIWEWSPPLFMHCSSCQSPLFFPEETTTYTLHVEDIYGCFENTYQYTVHVVEKYSVDMPDVFSPNGDGVNDQLYVRGWGIQDVLEFRIFNRWGQEVFRGYHKDHGWDGTYKGAPQNMDTYAYIVTVRHFDGSEKTLEGFVNLIR